MQDIDRKFRWPVSVGQQIAAPANEVWAVISTPGNLELCHPFCKSNPVEVWDRENSKDEVHYLSGWVYERQFRRWYEGVGYDLDIFRGEKKMATVSWRIVEVDAASCQLQITVYPMLLQKWPVVIRWLPHWLRLGPFLRSYLRSVVRGFEWYVARHEPVPRNAFGKHPWFSANVD